MMTEAQIHKAIANQAILKDFDGETGRPVEIDTDGETIAVRIVDVNFSRWTDSLDLTQA